MDYIGKYVKKYESGNKGSLCLDNCGYDWGLSAGSYQLTLRYGNCIKFLKKYFPKDSSILYFNDNAEDVKLKEWPGQHYSSSPEVVKEVWINCYNKVGEEKFFEYEHQYIKEQYYDRIKKKIIDYIDLDRTCRAFQELFWSWSVNCGVTGCYNEFIKALGKINNKISSFEKLFDACYDIRYENKGTNRYKKGLKDSERETLRTLLNVKGINVDSISSPTLLRLAKNKLVNYIGIITGGSVNIRKGPGKSYNIIKVINEGQKVRICKENDGWGYILFNGWVSLKYVSKI